MISRHRWWWLFLLFFKSINYSDRFLASFITTNISNISDEFDKSKYVQDSREKCVTFSPVKYPRLIHHIGLTCSHVRSLASSHDPDDWRLETGSNRSEIRNRFFKSHHQNNTVAKIFTLPHQPIRHRSPPQANRTDPFASHTFFPPFFFTFLSSHLRESSESCCCLDLTYDRLYLFKQHASPSLNRKLTTTKVYFFIYIKSYS